VPSTTEITVSQLSRLIGLPQGPAIIDVRANEEFVSDPRLIPGSRRRAFGVGATWAADYNGQSVIVVCQKGLHLSQGIGAWMRHQGIDAQTLEGGYEAWHKGGHLLVRADKLPQRDESGRTTWVTRARPKVVRIACPWLIRRFIDPNAVFLYVSPSEVAAVADRFKATTFDVPEAFWGDRGEKCTFPEHPRKAERGGKQTARLRREIEPPGICSPDDKGQTDQRVRVEAEFLDQLGEVHPVRNNSRNGREIGEAGCAGRVAFPTRGDLRLFGQHLALSFRPAFIELRQLAGADGP
jgi:rhodanese-related sulfurtransferase